MSHMHTRGYAHCSLLLKDLSLLLFAITAAGVVPCGGPKTSPRISSIVQIIFSFWSFDVSESILKSQKLIIGLDSFSNQRLYICLCLDIRHFSLLNVNAAGACGFDFPCDGGRLVRAYLRRRQGTI